MKSRAAWAVTVVAAAACGPSGLEVGGEDELAEVQQEAREQQGREQQGREQQGREQQGTASYFSIQYVSRINAKLQGYNFGYVWTEGSKLFGRFAHNNAVVSGAGMRGATFDAYDDSGALKKLRIATDTSGGLSSVNKATGSAAGLVYGAPAHKMDIDSASLMYSSAHQLNDEELHLYKVEFYDALIGGWRSLCPQKLDRFGVPTYESEMAIFTSFTFTGTTPWGVTEGYENQASGGSSKLGLMCWNGVAAKCMRWGYMPWLSLTPAGQTTPVSLRPYFESCVRAAMADYCGNGVSYTVDGTWIELWDNKNFIRKRSESVQPGFSNESAWNEDGATCLEKSRYDSLPASAADCPSRDYWIPVGDPGNSGTKPIHITMPTFFEGALSSCSSPSKYVFVDSSTYCHSPSATGRAQPKDCSATTAAVCNTQGCGYCCNKNDSRGWDTACVRQATGYPVGACGQQIIIASPQ